MFQKTFVDASKEEVLLERYCTDNSLIVAPVASNGQCFFEAFSMASSTNISPSTLKSKIRQDLKCNIAVYRPCIPDGEKDQLEEELNKYLNGGLFNSSVADLCVYAAANVTSTGINIVQFVGERVQTVTISPRNSTATSEVILALTNRHTQPHYSALIIEVGTDMQTPRHCNASISDNMTSSNMSDLDSDCEISIEELPEEPENNLSEFHDNNENIPILYRGKCEQFGNSKKVLAELLEPNLSKLCKQSPSRVQYNASFLVNLSTVDLGDVYAYGNGKYRCDGVRRILISWAKNGWITGGFIGGNFTPKANERILIRKYWKHSQHSDFLRRTYHVVNAGGQVVNNVILLQYLYQKEEHNIPLSSHGNSKSGQPFSRLRPSVRSSIAGIAMNCMPEQACSELLVEKGGIENVPSINEVPSRQILYNMKRRKYSCNADEWEALKDWSGENGKNYFKKLEEFPNPLLVLSTEQLNELEKFGTSEIEHCVVCVDPTFSLGRFNVTPISYKHLFLENSKANRSHPVMVGPLLIHYSKTKQVYRIFMETLASARPGLRALKAFGTDGELALIEALEDTFPQAVGLRCF